MPFLPEITIADVLRGIQRQEYVLPAIQREFVWEPDSQVVRLFDSLLRGYPVGTFLCWTVQPVTISTFKFYGFVRDYHQLSARHCPVLDLPGDKPVTAILDGQQRLTSLNIGLRGSHARRRKHGRVNDPSAYPRRELYLNLLADAPENELGTKHDFKFFEAPPSANLGPGSDGAAALWYPVRRIFDEASPIAAARYLLEAGLGAAEAFAVDRLGALYEKVHNVRLISFYQEEEQDIDKVLDIFIRVNSAGRPLSQSDLLLSIATAQFVERDARSAVHGLVDELNTTGPGFAFDKDTVLKAGLALVGAPDFSFKVSNFGRENTQLLDRSWDDIADTLRLAVDLLDDFGFSSGTLTARSVLIPVACYLHHRNLGQRYRTAGEFDGDRRVLRRWVNRTLIKPGIWGSGLDTLLRELRTVITTHGETGFPNRQIEESMRRRGKAIEFGPEEVVDLLATRYTQGGCFALLATMFPHVDTRNVFHIDHVFPQAMFTKSVLREASVAEAELERTLERRHRLANLQLLEGPVNVEKQASMPAKWALDKYAEGLDDYRARHDIPPIPDTFAGFERFYLERKRLLARRLAGVLGVDPEAAAALVAPKEPEVEPEPEESMAFLVD